MRPAPAYAPPPPAYNWTGGYWGAKAVKRLNAEGVRRGILIYAWGLTAWFFVRMAF